MKKITRLLILTSVILTSFASCKPKQSFLYIPLEKYKYMEAKIQPGRELELLAFSGGKKSDEESLYYYQFLVLDKATKDTLRIFTPIISFESSEGTTDKTYTTPLQYDPGKGITTAFYEPKDSTVNFALQAESLKNYKSGDAIDLNSLMGSINKKQFVVINRSMPEFDDPHYQAVIGVLHFKDQPW
jgi:hypothetical protein